MSKIRIYGDTSGYVDLTAPAVADNSALSIGDIATSSDISTKPDYESGIWTPKLYDGVTETEIPDAVYVSGFNGARYIKIGKMVNLFGSFRISSKGTVNSANRAAMGNFPFPSADFGSDLPENGFRSAGITSRGDILYLSDYLANYCRINDYAGTQYTLGTLSSTFYINFNLSYITD